jgi:hypothetical protein
MAGYIGNKIPITQVDGYNRSEADAEFVQVAGDTMTGGLTVSGVIATAGGTDINMDGAGSGQLTLDGNAYKSAIALNAQGMNVYTNSASRSVILGTNETERMRITGGGNVGIGNVSPASQLSVGGNTPSAGELSVVGAAGGIALALSDNANSSLYVRNAAGGSIIGTDGGGDLRFASGGNTAAEERMRINSSGNVLLGTTSTFDNVSFLTTQAVGGVATKIAGTGAASQMSFFNDNGRVGFILTSGTSTSYSTSSDYRLKTDAQPMTGASARVQALKPVNFEWIADGTRVDGFLAHELQDVVPEAATGTKDAVDADGNPEYQGIDQSKLVPLLTAALQEALTKINDMETRLAALEDN